MCDTNIKEKLDIFFDVIWRTSSAKTSDAERQILNLISQICLKRG